MSYYTLKTKIEQICDRANTLEADVTGLEAEITDINTAFEEKGVEVENKDYPTALDKVAEDALENFLVTRGVESLFYTASWTPDTLPTSKITDFDYMFSGYMGDSLPEMDTSNGVTFEGAFSGLGVKALPSYDFSNGVNFTNMLAYTQLQAQPEEEIYFNTEKGTNFSSMFSGCDIPHKIIINTDNGTNFYYMFSNAYTVKEIELSGTSKGTNFNYMFYYCSNLSSIKGLDLTKLSANNTTIFMNCSNLENLELQGTLSYGIKLSDCTNLTAESLLGVINALKDLTGSTSRTLTIGSANIAKLTEEQLGMITAKNWKYA